MRARTLTPVLSSLLLAAACGDVEDPMEDPDPMEEPDTTAPYLVSSTPEHGAAGVAADATITLVFSEPMDQGRFELALATAPLDEAALSLTWNAAGDTVTIRPDQPLELAEGQGLNPDAPLILHTILVGTAAQDRAGNPLEEGVEVSFTTLRRMTATFGLDDFRSRLIGSNDMIADEGTNFLLGDGVDGLYTRGVLTFDIGLIPLTTVEIEQASFSARQMGAVGMPYQKFGALTVEHVVFDEVTLDVFDQLGEASMGNLSEDAEAESKSIDVTTAVQDDWENTNARDGRSQYRLAFETDTDGDDQADYVGFMYDTFEMTVVYLAP